MKRLITLALIVLSFSALSESEINSRVLTLDGNNYFGVKGQFDGTMSDQFARKLFTFEGDEMFVYINSPGGSVFAMSAMIEQMRNSKVKFTCVAQFAASAAFMLFQHCTKRLILPDGIIMSHNASGGFQDEFPRIRTLLDVIEGVLKPIEVRVADRLKMSMKEYDTLINKNLWINATTAEKFHAADDVLKGVVCSKAITHEEKCPLLN